MNDIHNKIQPQDVSKEDDMSAQSRRRFLMSLMVPLTLSACAKQAPSEQTAKKFMDAYYVQIDLKQAEQLSDGLAKEKLAKQVSLLDGTSTGNSPGAGANAPSVTYGLVSQQSESPDEATYIFEVNPHVQDIGKRKVFVKVRQTGGKWSVTQFTEEDQPR